MAAVDINKATQADLESIKGIGPIISTKILDERKKGGPFKDWNDVLTRVKGVGEGNAAKFSGGRPDRERQGLSPCAAASTAKDAKVSRPRRRPTPSPDKDGRAKADAKAEKMSAAASAPVPTKAAASAPATKN